MSQENVEIVRRIYERYSEGDFTGSAEVLDRHAVLVLAESLDWGPETPDSGMYVGVESIASYTRDYLLAPWEGLTMKAEELIAAGDTVFVSVSQAGVGPASGVPAQMQYFTLWSFRGSKVIRIESFRKRDEALEAAGLSE
jgi:ketosteroid isomerase-like protein